MGFTGLMEAEIIGDVDQAVSNIATRYMDVAAGKLDVEGLADFTSPRKWWCGFIVTSIVVPYRRRKTGQPCLLSGGLTCYICLSTCLHIFAKSRSDGLLVPVSHGQTLPASTIGSSTLKLPSMVPFLRLPLGLHESHCLSQVSDHFCHRRIQCIRFLRLGTGHEKMLQGIGGLEVLVMQASVSLWLFIDHFCRLWWRG